MKTIHDILNKNTSGAVKISLAAVLATLLTAGGIVIAEKGAAAHAAKLELRLDPTPPPREGGSVTSFAPVVRKVTPAVVKVNVSAKAKQLGAPPGWPFNEDPMLRRFFGPGANLRPPQRGPESPKPRHGFGSGVIVTPDGYLITNNHVVDEADSIEVEMADHRTFKATLIGGDPKTDIAVLKIDAKDLPYTTLGDSSLLEIGDVVLAVGNPFGIGQTVTQGIVSGVGRAHMGLEYEDFIQTDAAINPGNSGGALVDATGRLVGINTAIISRGGGNDGIGFAVPVNLARHVLESIVSTGHVERGYLGVRIQDVTPELAKAFDIKEAKGALIAAVEDNGPAAKAGLKPGDVVREFNGQPVADSRVLKLAVGQSAPQGKAMLKVLRDGQEIRLSARLNPLKEKTTAALSHNTDTNDEGALQGMQVADLTRENRDQHEIPASLQGVLVVQVETGTAVAEAGIQSGDVILEINRKPVSNADAAIALTKDRHHDTTLLRVWRAGSTRYVVVNEKPVS